MMKRHGIYKKFIKRMLDVLLSGLALIVLGIPMLIVALLIRKDMGSPVIFRQERSGMGGKSFRMCKFRSMTDARDEHGIFLPDDQRITRLGNIIRKTSIDELPSLLNILAGDMSIIGPRPLPVRYLERYTDEQRRRLEVRPGLSNPATADGRNSQTWEHQFEGDVWYVDHLSFAVDVKSVINTVLVVLKREGATDSDGTNRGEFVGTADIEELKKQNDANGNYMTFKE